MEHTQAVQSNHNEFDLPHSLSVAERTAYTQFISHAIQTPGMNKSDLLSSITLTTDASAAPLSVLSTLLASIPGPWPTFDLLCCYAKLWKQLPESSKRGSFSSESQLLDRISLQIKNTYTGIHSLLPQSDKPAILDAVSSNVLSHQSLSAFVQHFSLPVTAKHDRKPVIALALPNGPLLGVAILATTAYYTAAPMSVATGGEQFRSDILQSGASVILAIRSDISRLGLSDPWVLEAGIEVILLDVNGDSTFNMTYVDLSPVIPVMGNTPNGPDDIALILFTSGTSGKKKVVPYTVHTMVSGIAFVIESWGLTQTDICMNMMPLFHVGGIIRNLFAPILAGGSTICCPAFDANLFWDVVEDRQPTWYYASPSMHSVILEESQNRPEALSKSNIRLICNAAGGLLPSLACTLRDTFSCIVLPSYGMTECMPISSPPLTYKLDRSGTSGTSVGPDLAILDGNDKKLPIQTVGRIAVRGAPVFDGYLKEGNVIDKSCFTADGWFDTGDMGYLDADGYLFVTGRSKEVINRGGELISPFEVEEAIVIAASREDSPLFGRASAALAFSMPHDVLQEVVGIVLVTPAGAKRADIKTVHDAVKDSLGQVKWPAYIVYMEDLPKNNNKILRIKLAERLDLGEITDETPLADRHFEATCPPPNTALSQKIRGSVCSSDLTLVSRKLSEAVGSNIDVCVRKASHDGYPEAFFAPRKDSGYTPSLQSIPSFDVVLRTQLEGYMIPSKFHILDTPLPRDEQGSVDDAQLESLIQVGTGLDNIDDTMSPTERTIAHVFVRILSCNAEELTSESDFFELGGDSLRAGRLLSELRKEFNIRLPINLLFTHSRISSLASNIDKLRVEKSDDEKKDGYQVDVNVVNQGCDKTYSSTNFFLMVLQLIPIVLLYPMRRALTWTIFMYALTETRDWVTSNYLGGRLFNLILALGVGRACSAVIFPCIGITVKWVLIGKYKEGLHPMWGPYHTRWWFVDKTLTACGRGVFGTTDFTLIWYYRIMGAKIGKGVKIATSATIREFDLLEIGDGANLDKCICRGFAAERNTSMYLGRIRLGKMSSVGLGSIVAPGTSLPEDACIGPNSSSWETSDANEENRNLSSSKVPGTHFLLELLVITPVSAIVTLLRAGPWIGGLAGIVMIQPQASTDKVKSIIDWFAAPNRIGFHYLALIFNNYFGPMAWFMVAWALKKVLDAAFGRLSPGPAASRSQGQRFKMAMLKKVVPMSTFHKLTEIFGAHYEVTSRLYRSMGAKIGKRVYWPGTGPAFQDFDLLDIGNDVVFGSRSHIVTSDGIGSAVVKIGDGAMIADRVTLLPGASVGKGAVFGSGALTRRNQHYGQDTVWVGSKAGEAICLSGGADTQGNVSQEDLRKELSEKDSKSLPEISLQSTPNPGWMDDEKHSFTTPNMSSRASLASFQASQQNATSTPFGRAFYEGKAPYRVFGIFTIFLYSSFVTIFTSVYWNVATTSSVQVVARIIDHTEWDFVADGHAYRPVLIFALFTFSISILMTVQAVVAIATVIIAKWLIMGRRKAGNYDWDKSSYCQRWQLFLTIEKLRRHCYGGHGILGLLTGTHFVVLYFRALGATIGKDCAIFAGGLPSLMFTEPDLLTLGDRVSVDDASLVSHINSRGVFNLNPLVVGDRSVLRSGARLLSGAQMGKDSVLLEHTLVMAGDVVDDGCTYQGWPGDSFRGERAPLSSAHKEQQKQQHGAVEEV
ncbi:hypothetical protein MBLNU459_g3241t1 [Dothideomycetes sp. NU459]